tara:strand:+ start:288 stop:1160 length:873 start_codon:yes stop_codon:yes gene_type:complete
MRILIIGARGLLGSFLYDKLHEKYSVFGSSRNKIKNYYKLDLNSRSDIKKIIKAGRFDVIINTSGLIDVNKCNKNLALAKKFNTQSIKKLSNVLKEVDQKPHLIHFSTDQIYNSEDPTKSNKENDVKITNNYSKSKYLGELSTHIYKKKTILRTNFFGDTINSKKLSFSDYLIKNLKKKKITRVPINIYFSPIHMSFIPDFLQKIISKKLYGTFNLGSSSGISKYEFSKEIAKIRKLPIKFLSPYFSNIKIHQRPNGTIMNVMKIEKKLKIKLPTINKSIQMLSKSKFNY